MHILVVNDDGPPSNQSSPYIHSFISALQSAGHTVSVILPHCQRSWIGKAHMVGQTLTPTYFRPGTVLKDDGITSERPFDDGGEEWVLIDGTPASCTQIGLHHFFQDRGPVDVVVSGPNYGRNTTALFALSSGTIGGAMEAAVNGKKAIALSYAFDSRDHIEEIISAASKLSTKLIEKFVNEWPEDVHLYSINVPLRPGVADTKIVYTDMLQNKWSSGSSFQEVPEEVDDTDPNVQEHIIRENQEVNGVSSNQVAKRMHRKFKWAPNFADVRKSVQDAGKGDGWAVSQGFVSVTPLKANFWHLPHYSGEIKLNDENPKRLDKDNDRNKTTISAVVNYPDTYVQPLFVDSLRRLQDLHCEFLSSIDDLANPEGPVLQFTDYETIDFEHAIEHPRSSLICAYTIRKALIRKHFLSNTISTWITKHPDTILRSHFKPCVHFELDYAEFLDEALIDAWDLNESMIRNDECTSAAEKEWWILKPGMSDGGNGIRLFSNMQELQSIFEEWEEGEDEEGEHDEDGAVEQAEAVTQGNVQKVTTDSDTFDPPEERGGAMTSQLRHFIAQPYIDPPLLLQAYQGRKFHIRAYVVAVGALKVYVSKEMLALFAAKPYRSPEQIRKVEELDLAEHLTNTCFQDESTRSSSVFPFWSLESVGMSSAGLEQIFAQICNITGEVFEAAAREQMVHFQTIPNAFEIFGVDFLIDSSAKVWLLELNAYPDFKQTGPVLQDTIVGSLFQEVVQVVVQPFFDPSKKHLSQGSAKLPLVRTMDLGRG